MLPKLSTIGRVAGKQGFQGELLLHFQKDSFANAIHQGDFLFVSIDGKGVPFLMERYNPQKGIVKLADVESEKQAAELEGLPVCCPMDQLEIFPDSPFDDLIGYTILDETENKAGILEAIEEYPAGPMFVIQAKEGTILIPAREEWITNIDPKKKTLHIDAPEGLWDL